jgi:hypothetical protein
MHDNVHIGGKFHRFLVKDYRPFDQIIALTVGIESVLFGTPILPHERVVTRKNIGRIGARPDHIERKFPGFEREFEFVEQIR